MASGFKSVNNSPVKIPKALSIAIAQALTEKMESIFKEIEDPRIERNRVHLLTDFLTDAGGLALSVRVLSTGGCLRNIHWAKLKKIVRTQM
jgi:hypothetical protein